MAPKKPPQETLIHGLERFKGLDLPLQHESFVVAYCSDYTFNGTRAYQDIVAPDMDNNSAAASASRLLRSVNVRKAVSIQMEWQLRDTDALARRIIDEHSKIAFAHSSMIMDGINSFGYIVKDFADIPDEYKAAIAGFKKTETGMLEVKFYDKQKSLDSLARILGMFDDGAARTGEKYEDLVKRARAARETK